MNRGGYKYSALTPSGRNGFAVSAAKPGGKDFAGVSQTFGLGSAAFNDAGGEFGESQREASRLRMRRDIQGRAPRPSAKIKIPARATWPRSASLLTHVADGLRRRVSCLVIYRKGSAPGRSGKNNKGA
jgi:hypothetical protein